MEKESLALRMISGQCMVERQLVYWCIKKALSRPSQVMHLPNKRFLSENGANKLDRVYLVIEISVPNLGMSGRIQG